MHGNSLLKRRVPSAECRVPSDDETRDHRPETRDSEVISPVSCLRLLSPCLLVSLSPNRIILPFRACAGADFLLQWTLQPSDLLPAPHAGAEHRSRRWSLASGCPTPSTAPVANFCSPGRAEPTPGRSPAWACSIAYSITASTR